MTIVPIFSSHRLSLRLQSMMDWSSSLFFDKCYLPYPYRLALRSDPVFPPKDEVLRCQAREARSYRLFNRSILINARLPQIGFR
jgi:hypothetical protein